MTVDSPGFPISLCSGRYVRGVGTRVRLGECEGGPQFATGNAGEIGSLLRIASADGDGPRGEEVDGEEQG